jgi:hypothetical protein
VRTTNRLFQFQLPACRATACRGTDEAQRVVRTLTYRLLLNLSMCSVLGIQPPRAPSTCSVLCVLNCADADGRIVAIAGPQETNPTVRESRVYVGVARSSTDVEQARELHTRAYEREGLISPLPAGVAFDDGWMNQRHWLVANDGRRVVGAVSLITPRESLPTLLAFGVCPAKTPRLAAPWADRRVFEVSTLVVDTEGRVSPTLGGLLIRAVWRHREERLDHDVWLMSMRWKRFDRLCAALPVPFELIGRTSTYYNGPSVAFLADLRLWRSALSMRAPVLLDWLEGGQDDRMPRRNATRSVAPAPCRASLSRTSR